MLPEVLILSYFSCLIIIIGLLLNGFIVIANLSWWMKRQTLQTINVLITGLGLVRIVLLTICAQVIYFLISGVSMFQVDAYPEYTSTLTSCMIFCSMWWGSLLCVFYCVKITNYSHRLFIRLKMNISKVVPRLLLISLVISFLCSLPCRWAVFSIHGVNGTVYGNEIMEINVVNLVVVIFAGSIPPFIIFCVSIYLIIVSLLRHSRNMSSRDSGFSDAQRDVHLSVIRSMISFLLLYVLYFGAYIILTIVIRLQIPNSICFICICAFPSLHSISLIYSNKELKRSFCVVLSCTWLGN